MRKQNRSIPLAVPAPQCPHSTDNHGQVLQQSEDYTYGFASLTTPRPLAMARVTAYGFAISWEFGAGWLWLLCLTEPKPNQSCGGGLTCSSCLVPPSAAMLQAVRALMIVGIVLGAISLLVSIFALKCIRIGSMEDAAKANMTLTSGIMFIISGKQGAKVPSLKWASGNVKAKSFWQRKHDFSLLNMTGPWIRALHTGIQDLRLGPSYAVQNCHEC